MRFSHQDSPSADAWVGHRCRSSPPAPASVECRLAGACAEEPRPKSLTVRCGPDQRRRPHRSTGCGLLVRKPHYYQVPASLGRAWVHGGELLFLLDGLDEIADFDDRTACIEAVNR